MINKFLLEDIVCLIETFTGPNYWKLHFSKKYYLGLIRVGD